MVRSGHLQPSIIQGLYAPGLTHYTASIGGSEEAHDSMQILRGNQDFERSPY